MKTRSGYSLVELLTTISIITVLVAVLVPTSAHTRRYARRLLSVRNQREIVVGVSVYACENGDSYPASVALSASGKRSWRWQDPRQTRTCSPRPNMSHASVSGYLNSYIDKSETLYCPSAPARYAYWEEAWQAGDLWDHPETEPAIDPVLGTYCFFWNYVGYIEENTTPFIGPTSQNGIPGESQILVSDYLGYDNWRMPLAVGSCEYLPRAEVAFGTCVSSDFWAYRGRRLSENSELSVHASAGYTDGHVARFDPKDVVTLRVAYDPKGLIPFPRSIESPGDFYVPLELSARRP